MTKTPKTKIFTLKSSGAQVFIHLCEHCEKQGSFGYGVSLRKNRLGKWYCRDHKPILSNSTELKQREQ
jgi:hypothetical protein